MPARVVVRQAQRTGIGRVLPLSGMQSVRASNSDARTVLILGGTPGRKQRSLGQKRKKKKKKKNAEK
jgi:hypothetical protein